VVATEIDRELSEEETLRMRIVVMSVVVDVVIGVYFRVGSVAASNGEEVRLSTRLLPRSFADHTSECFLKIGW
jgi:hypothetical protein